MVAVDDKGFNGVFVSYAHEDVDFARQFQQKLQEKLDTSMYVWMDDNLLEGKEWRREIQRQLNSTALVVVILSPDSIKSPWVLFEWHYSLLVQQSEPFLVHFRKCEDKYLKRFTDYQLADALVEREEQAKDVWMTKAGEIERTLDKIAGRLQKFSELRENYAILTDVDAGDKLQQKAAYNLGNVPEGLRLAAANYLIEALEFWISHGVYGPVGASIANELGRLGKRKAMPTLVQFFLAQANPPYLPALNSVQRALALLSCEEPF
jgi:hypothetical protein